LVSANYLLRRIAALFNEKDGTDDGKRMASNWEVILTPFLRLKNVFIYRKLFLQYNFHLHSYKNTFAVDME